MAANDESGLVGNPFQTQRVLYTPLDEYESAANAYEAAKKRLDAAKEALRQHAAAVDAVVAGFAKDELPESLEVQG